MLTSRKWPCGGRGGSCHVSGIRAGSGIVCAHWSSCEDRCDDPENIGECNDSVGVARRMCAQVMLLFLVGFVC